MITASVSDLLAAYSDHQITARELVTEARQLTSEERTVLRTELQAAPAPTAIGVRTQPSNGQVH